MNNEQTINGQLVYAMSKKFLGTSLVPIGDDPEVGCAISVTVLLKDKCGINIPETTSTLNLLYSFKALPNMFKEVSDPIPGDIIISATGTSTIPNTPITHGHVGIVGKYGICSNNSYTGLWSESYTLESWKVRYQQQGGYPILYFRVL